jgi:hypothetical protein
LLDAFVEYDAEGESHVFIPLHGSVEVENLDFGYYEAGVGGGDHTVEEALGGPKLGGGRADGARVTKAIAANGEPGAIRFRFLWANCGNNASIGDFTVRGDLVLADPPDGIGARRHASTYPVG